MPKLLLIVPVGIEISLVGLFVVLWLPFNRTSRN